MWTFFFRRNHSPISHTVQIEAGKEVVFRGAPRPVRSRPGRQTRDQLGTSCGTPVAYPVLQADVAPLLFVFFPSALFEFFQMNF
jgi:hypothetical protein